MNEQITTWEAALKAQTATAYSTVPLGAPVPAHATTSAQAVDVLSFLFLIVFQCGAVIALVIYTPQIGEMGLVVFGIIFVWLGATLIIGVCDLCTRPARASS